MKMDPPKKLVSPSAKNLDIVHPMRDTQKSLSNGKPPVSKGGDNGAQIFRRENLIIGVLLFACYLIGGYYIRFYRGYLPGDAISRLVSAWLVSQGTVVKFSSIGFVWPPIPTLLLIPWALTPSLFQNWMAVVVVSALSMAVACIMVGQIASICRISTWWRRVFVFLFAVNPLVIIFAINGMSEAILMAATLIACFWLIRFWQTSRNSHLIFSAAFFGLLPLIRYEFALISAWSGLVILLLLWEKRHQFTREKFGQFLEGVLLAYSSLAIYPFFLWVIANWFIMGSPFYFLVNNRSNANVAEFQLADYGIITTPLNSFQITFQAWFWTFPVGLIASVALILLGWKKKSNFLIGFGLMPLIVPALQFLLLISRSNVPLLRYFVMVVPLGLVVSMVFLYAFSILYNRIRGGKIAVTILIILLLLSSNVMSVIQLNSYPYQTFDGATWRALTGQGDARDLLIVQAYDIGKLLVETVPTGSKILMDIYGYGYAVLLGANTHKIFMDFTDTNYDAALLNPQGYVDYILVPAPYQTNNFYAVNLYQKSLYANGASWAELVNILPETIDGWKLYKIKK